MATVPELVSMIRFGLSQLGASNAHHQFEHLCRHLTRARICANVLPATGPVSAGGDQGRDFETFRTYLAGTGLADSSFFGRISSGALAFACTTQQDAIDRKIRDDVETILATGTRVVGIHIFLSADLPVARRHAVQKWCAETHHVDLDIHDANSIAELLAASDVFWIASRFLTIPADVFPVEDGASKPEWYVSLRERLKDAKEPDLSYSNFYDVKRALRRSTYAHDLKVDLTFWIERMKEL